MKIVANADRPKSAAAMLPPRPLRRSGKVAQTACNSDRREGKSCIPTLNQTFADSRILKISKFPTFRIADKPRFTSAGIGFDEAVSPVRHRPKFIGLWHCSGGGLWGRLRNPHSGAKTVLTAPCWRPYAESVTGLGCRRRSLLSRVHEEVDEVIGLQRRGFPDRRRFPRIPSPRRNGLFDRRCTYARDDGPRAPQAPHRGGIRDSDNPRNGSPR